MRINQEVVTPNLTPSVSIGLNSIDSSMNEEFSALYKAIGTAVFLIFVVMAAQFESPRYSFMVMTTIPFSLIGAFGLLFLTNCKISMAVSYTHLREFHRTRPAPAAAGHHWQYDTLCGGGAGILSHRA